MNENLNLPMTIENHKLTLIEKKIKSKGRDNSRLK